MSTTILLHSLIMLLEKNKLIKKDELANVIEENYKMLDNIAKKLGEKDKDNGQ